MLREKAWRGLNDYWIAVFGQNIEKIVWFHHNNRPACLYRVGGRCRRCRRTTYCTVCHKNFPSGNIENPLFPYFKLFYKNRHRKDRNITQKIIFDVTKSSSNASLYVGDCWSVDGFMSLT